MRVEVRFQDESAAYDVVDDRLIGVWQGPNDGRDASSKSAGEIVREAIEAPLDYPPLRQAVVPGDRLVIAFDSRVPEANEVLNVVWETLSAAGIERNDVLVITTGAVAEGSIPADLPFEIHDVQGDRSRFAYLASTSEGRRVYLHRSLHDADFVLPIGCFDQDPILGRRGPWGVIFPGLSDLETLRAFQKLTTERRVEPSKKRLGFRESIEVSRLLGSQFQIGVFASKGRVVAALAGLDDSVRIEATSRIDERSTFRVDRQADLVVAGVGDSKRAVNLDELSQALSIATRLVRPGGKIALLSRASGSIGPAFKKLAAEEDPRIGPSALRGFESAEDYPTARRVAKALASAELYLLSGLDRDFLEDLGIIPLNRAEDVQRLVKGASSSIFLSETESVRAVVAV